MERYNAQAIEKKWQKYWDENKTFKTEDSKCGKKKFYALVEFPYPSAQGLHVGHPRPYTAMDIVSRKRRLEGYNVLFPMGWDAFGLPAENYAIKNKIHPSIITNENISRFKKQLKAIGLSFDWDREINTTDPNYYKWTQWIFIQMFKKGLAYKKEMPINWCPSCKTGLANEEVVNGCCDRCGTSVEHRVKNQWMLKITQYADRLIDDLEEVDYLHKIKQQQINWIGRSYGAEIDFKIAEQDYSLKVFTTRPDTVFGVTYMVIACEHPLLEKFKDKITNYEDILAYNRSVQSKSDLERTELNKEKTGVHIKGLQVVHPITGELIPLYVSDYVLMSYGTGAIMAVPAHDDRDYEFAKKFDLPIRQVISNNDGDVLPLTETTKGTLINSDFLNGLQVQEAIDEMIVYLEEKEIGDSKVNYKLRDWIFSRQRYWGEPIPMIYCDQCGWVPVPEEELPLKLPEVEKYEPTDDGQSPLSKIEDFIHVNCPVCGKPAHRETDTMPQWAGSSWYYLRYMDPKNEKEIGNKDEINYFSPVDWYNGGMEHTTLHLLYSRFWHKFLYDLGIVPTKEPYQKRTSHGMILGNNNEKMSKSRGNVVNPDDIINEYGADTLRCYEMFIGDFEKSVPWSEQGVKGSYKFLERCWNLQNIVTDGQDITPELRTLMHKTIKKVSHDYENLKFNTAIAQLMTLLNEFNKIKKITREDLRIFLILLNPVAPHITEEMWERIGLSGHITDTQWPTFDPEACEEARINMPIQINGKVRATLEVASDILEDDLMAQVLANQGLEKYLKEKTIVKKIYVPGKILNLVIK